MKNDKPTLEFFPKDKELRIVDAFFYLMVFGTFGAHQFYLGNRRRAYYLLVTCGISHLSLLLSPIIYPHLKNGLGFKIAMLTLFAGYFLGVPVLIWDFITLSSQVRNKKGQADLL